LEYVTWHECRRVAVCLFLLCCVVAFLLFPVLFICPSASEPFSSVWLPIIPLPFHSVPYHTVGERARLGGAWFQAALGCLFFFFSIRFSVSSQIHLHYVVFVCLLLWSQFSNARYIVPPHAFGIPSFETFIFARFQHFPNPRLVRSSRWSFAFLPLFSCVGVC
jgi:hypothetical protein